MEPKNASGVSLTRRHFLRLSTLAIGGAALVACAPAPAGSGTTTSSNESAPAVANVEVSMWMFSLTDPDLLKLIDETVGPNFTGIRPEFTLGLEFVPYEGYREKIATNLAGGTLPDIHESGTQEAGRVATSGMGIPLDDMMETWEDYADYFETSIAGTRYGGYTWGVPFRTEPSCLLYWKSVCRRPTLLEIALQHWLLRSLRRSLRRRWLADDCAVDESKGA